MSLLLDVIHDVEEAADALPLVCCIFAWRRTALQYSSRQKLILGDTLRLRNHNAVQASTACCVAEVMSRRRTELRS